MTLEKDNNKSIKWKLNNPLYAADFATQNWLEEVIVETEWDNEENA